MQHIPRHDTHLLFTVVESVSETISFYKVTFNRNKSLSCCTGVRSTGISRREYAHLAPRIVFIMSIRYYLLLEQFLDGVISSSLNKNIQQSSQNFLQLSHIT